MPTSLQLNGCSLPHNNVEHVSQRATMSSGQC
jgi:hypothetical protein